MKEENLDAMKYRKSTHLAGVDVDLMTNKIVTIKKCWYETNVNVSGNKTTGYFMSFEEDIKDMVVNSTNRLSIIRLLQKTTKLSLKDCRNTGNWSGLKIELYFDENIKMMGKQTGGIRIKSEPVSLPELNPAHEKWQAAKDALKAGQVTIEQIKKNFTLTKENEEVLQND